MATAAALTARPGDLVRLAFGTGADAAAHPGARAELVHWLRSQAINAARAALLIRPFEATEFGTGATAPGGAHLAAANDLIARLRALVQANAREQHDAGAAAAARLGRAELDRAARVKEQGTALVMATERIWAFYWEIFGQRQTSIADRLLAADRIALDCYQYTYGGLGKARSIPSPAPFAYTEAGMGPATYRRFVRLGRLGRLPNPFPLVKLPYHRLVCPWTLGAIPHEVAHNLQSDLGLWVEIPRRVYQALRRAGIASEVARVWVRWHKEVFADLLGVLLIGPAFVPSLMDVVAKAPELVASFTPRAVHPVPLLRVLINLELLRQIGFEPEAAAYRAAWLRLYPPALQAALPAELRTSFPKACSLVVETMCFTPYPQLGGRRLAEVVAFRRQDQAVAREAAHRLALGRDPGIVPERFLIPAARLALDHKLAAPAAITRHFYDALGRR